jgi:hypothetical protein
MKKFITLILFVFCLNAVAEKQPEGIHPTNPSCGQLVDGLVL